MTGLFSGERVSTHISVRKHNKNRIMQLVNDNAVSLTSVHRHI